MNRYRFASMLQANGFSILPADSCGQGIEDAQTRRPDICIIDPYLPDRSGIHFIREVRRRSPVPIVVLTAQMAEPCRVEALDAGADDCIVKPVSDLELLARMRAIMRRFARVERVFVPLQFGAAKVDMAQRIARKADGSEVALTQMEYRILECLARNKGAVVPIAQLLLEVWGPWRSTTGPLRVYISRLRRKLESDPLSPKHLLTVASIGYRLLVDDAPPQVSSLYKDFSESVD